MYAWPITQHLVIGQHTDMAKLSYGPVFVSAGPLKGRILYYDDDATLRTAICYAGHPIDFVGTYDVQKRYLRDPTIDELLNRREAIHRMLNEIAIDDDWDSMEPSVCISSGLNAL